jgi:L,D-peptidoglycan transpeptidase YkuD (ErfK/YbiS/YcfS/YnhG family)
MGSGAIAMVTGVAVVGAGLLTTAVPTAEVTPVSVVTGPATTNAGAGATSTGAEATSPRPAAESRPPYHPSRLTHLGNARQVVVVTASTWKTSYATVRTYNLTSSGWHRQFTKKNGRIGTHGFAPFGARRQNSGETPAGTYRLLRAFGSATDPGTALRYRKFDRNDWWPYDPRDPRTYNVEQYHGRSAATQWRKSWAEHLWHFRDQYRYAVVLNYNLPSGLYASGNQRFAANTANTGAGGGIFLHVNGPGATAGCVSVSRKAMRMILRWLNPAQHPVIVMAPTKAIGRA